VRSMAGRPPASFKAAAYLLKRRIACGKDQRGALRALIRYARASRSLCIAPQRSTSSVGRKAGMEEEASGAPSSMPCLDRLWSPKARSKASRATSAGLRSSRPARSRARSHLRLETRRPVASGGSPSCSGSSCSPRCCSSPDGEPLGSDCPSWPPPAWPTAASPDQCPASAR
jgi:hypothetical protein